MQHNFTSLGQVIKGAGTSVTSITAAARPVETRLPSSFVAPFRSVPKTVVFGSLTYGLVTDRTTAVLHNSAGRPRSHPSPDRFEDERRLQRCPA